MKKVREYISWAYMTHPSFCHIVYSPVQTSITQLIRLKGNEMFVVN